MVLTHAPEQPSRSPTHVLTSRARLSTISTSTGCAPNAVHRCCLDNKTRWLRRRQRGKRSRATRRRCGGRKGGSQGHGVLECLAPTRQRHQTIDFRATPCDFERILPLCFDRVDASPRACARRLIPVLNTHDFSALHRVAAVAGVRPTRTRQLILAMHSGHRVLVCPFPSPLQRLSPHCSITLPDDLARPSRLNSHNNVRRRAHPTVFSTLILYARREVFPCINPQTLRIVVIL